MKKRPLFFVLLTLSLVLSLLSCKKNSGGTNIPPPPTDKNPLVGSWALVSENWQFFKTFEYTDGADIKTVNASVSSISNPTGIFSFTDSTVAITNLSYTLATTYAYATIKNGSIAKTDSASGTLNQTFKDTSMSNPYRLIGTDSVLFMNGSYILTKLGSAGVAGITAQSGGTFLISGNSLTITSVVDSVAHDFIFGAKKNRGHNAS